MRMNPALVIALIGAAAVFFYMQRQARAAPIPTNGAVLFSPEHPPPVDWT